MSVVDEVTASALHPVVVSPERSRFLALPAGVGLVEGDGVSPGVTYPAGFLASGIAGGLKESGRPDMGVVAVAPEWRDRAVSAGVFTTNSFAAAPVVVTRSECEVGRLVAVGMSSGNANACTGDQGLEVARAMQKACAEELGVAASRVAVGSTGVIGQPMDGDLMTAGMKKAAAVVGPDGGAEFNRSMMTTDRFPKACALTVETVDGSVRLGACAKGAGMIAPAMATMLCVVTSDAVLTSEEAAELLVQGVDQTFNRITVDGEMSTNDSVFLLASGASGMRPGTRARAQIAAALEAMLRRVALMMVADGEGATKVMRLRVTGADTGDTAATVARAIAGSPLVKTAMHGCDPNWGRIASSAGAALAGRALPRAGLKLCGVTLFKDGAGRPLSDEERQVVAAGMREPEVEIEFDLGLGEDATDLYFADMGHEYITINAEYHT